MVIIGILLTMNVQAFSAKDYMQRFTAFTQWNEQLPEQPDEKFFAFIDSDTPLAKKLREKWLYKVARSKDWQNYRKHYQSSKDPNLQCFAFLADYYAGQTAAALNGAQALWLTGDSQPGACDQLFEFMMQDKDFNEQLISRRIDLAMEKQNFPLVRHLLKKYHKPRLQDEQLLLLIHQNPARITLLEPGELHDEFYLYGLKRLVSTNMNKALQIWQNPKTRKILSQAQQQAFLTHVALYKALRNHDDANDWFAKIKATHYSDMLVDWQIRSALKNQNWAKVEQLINQSPQKDSPCWQYWLARSKEARGFKEDASSLYQHLAQDRNYYGFLASLRLKQQLNFKNESAINNPELLKPYKAVTDQIKHLYLSKQTAQASRLLNDFISELPKNDKSALLNWIAGDLRWYGKSVSLSDSDELTDQLSLRFPLANNNDVSAYARQYNIPAELIYSIIRQESGFRDDVISKAGARGLMQIMPETASMVARHEKIFFTDKNQLFTPKKNINIGAAYLQELTKRFNKHPLIVAAAYNAGPWRANYWLRNHPPKQMDIWVETLPWHETRNYLKNIVAFYAVYQYRLQHKSDLEKFMRGL